MRAIEKMDENEIWFELMRDEGNHQCEVQRTTTKKVCIQIELVFLVRNEGQINISRGYVRVCVCVREYYVLFVSIVIHMNYYSNSNFINGIFYSLLNFGGYLEMTK